MKKNSFLILPIAIFYIAIFRFIYLENGLSLIVEACFPILVGIMLAAVLNPILAFMEKVLRIQNRYLAVTLTYLFVFLMFAIFVTIVTPNILISIKQISKDIPRLYDRGNELFSILGDNIIVETYFTEITGRLTSLFTTLINNALAKVIDIFSAIANALLSFIISVYILIDKEIILNWLKEFSASLIGKKNANEMIKIGHKLYHNISGYISGKVFSSLIIAVLIYAGSKYILKCPYPLIDGVVIGITNMIPYFGTFIGGIPIVLINLLYNPQKGFLLFILILILQQVESLFIDPKIIANQLAIRPLLVIISIIIGGSLFGPLGLFFAAPVAALIKSIVDVYMFNRKEKNTQIIDKNR